MQHRKQALITLLFAGILSLATAQAMAKDDAHRHHDGGTSAGLSLNNGAKWKTDAPLREGMKNIRNVLEPQLPAIHNNKLKPAQYQTLAGEINAELSAIVKSCKLDKDADAMLHLVLAGIIEGVDALAGENKQVGRHDGAVKIYKGLENYGAYFAHPNWQPMTHAE